MAAVALPGSYFGSRAYYEGALMQEASPVIRLGVVLVVAGWSSHVLLSITACVLGRCFRRPILLNLPCRTVSSCQGQYSYLDANVLEERTSKVRVWAFAIDVRKNPSKGLQPESEDKVLYHYTNEQALQIGFRNGLSNPFNSSNLELVSIVSSILAGRHFP